MRYLIIAVLMVMTGYAAGGERQEIGRKDFSGFEVFDVSAKKFIGLDNTWLVRGQMKNNTAKDYKMALFQLSFFDENKRLIGNIAGITVRNFLQGEEIVFEQMSQDDLSNWSSYTLRLTHGM